MIDLYKSVWICLFINTWSYFVVFLKFCNIKIEEGYDSSFILQFQSLVWFGQICWDSEIWLLPSAVKLTCRGHLILAIIVSFSINTQNSVTYINFAWLEKWRAFREKPLILVALCHLHYIHEEEKTGNCIKEKSLFWLWIDQTVSNLVYSRILFAVLCEKILTVMQHTVYKIMLAVCD